MLLASLLVALASVAGDLVELLAEGDQPHQTFQSVGSNCLADATNQQTKLCHVRGQSKSGKAAQHGATVLRGDASSSCGAFAELVPISLSDDDSYCTTAGRGMQPPTMASSA